jgi:hypothetical protein
MDKKSGSGSRMSIEQPVSYFLELRNHFFGAKKLEFFDADPGSGMEKIRIQDGKKLDKHPGSATLC